MDVKLIVHCFVPKFVFVQNTITPQYFMYVSSFFSVLSLCDEGVLRKGAFYILHSFSRRPESRHQFPASLHVGHLTLGRTNALFTPLCLIRNRVALRLIKIVSVICLAHNIGQKRKIVFDEFDLMLQLLSYVYLFFSSTQNLNDPICSDM